MKHNSTTQNTTQNTTYYLRDKLLYYIIVSCVSCTEREYAQYTSLLTYSFLKKNTTDAIFNVLNRGLCGLCFTVERDRLCFGCVSVVGCDFGGSAP